MSGGRDSTGGACWAAKCPETQRRMQRRYRRGSWMSPEKRPATDKGVVKIISVKKHMLMGLFAAPRLLPSGVWQKPPNAATDAAQKRRTRFAYRKWLFISRQKTLAMPSTAARRRVPCGNANDAARCPRFLTAPHLSSFLIQPRRSGNHGFRMFG